MHAHPCQSTYTLQSLGSQGLWTGQVIGAATSLLNHIITWVTSGLLTQKEDAQYLLEQIYTVSFLPTLLLGAKVYGNGITGKSINQLLYVLSELVLSSSKFLSQFVDAGGLEIVDSLECGVFDLDRAEQVIAEYGGGTTTTGDTCDTGGVSAGEVSRGPLRDWSKYYIEALISGLQISSQLARHSEQHFRSLLQVFGAAKLAHILQSPHAVVKAKACNLVGNLCRHSDRYYATLAAALPEKRGQYALIDVLINCCADRDANTRKFASFAVGNAAFHSAALYPQLASCLAPLLAALADGDEKTRANSAGAIGNLVRNSGLLSGRMAQLGVVEKLLEVFIKDEDITTQRIALFSLGTMAVYTETRSRLVHAVSPSVNEVLERCRDKFAGDEVITKYGARLKQKLKLPVQSDT